MTEILYAALIDAVQTAGSLIRKSTGSRMAVEFKTSWSDLVTAVDRAVEQAVREAIRTRFPDHGLVGEEMGGGWDREYTWVLDPLDGTTNFAHTLPNFVCSLACYRHGEPVVGAIYDPNRDELFAARRGGGATLNGLPMAVDLAQTLRESLIGTNLLWDVRENRFHGLPALQELGKEVRGIRSLGAAALELAYVACGRLTGFVQFKLSPWDYGAGLLLVTEAGGRVTQMDGAPMDITTSSSVVATNGLIHDDVLHHLRRG